MKRHKRPGAKKKLSSNDNLKLNLLKSLRKGEIFKFSGLEGGFNEYMSALNILENNRGHLSPEEIRLDNLIIETGYANEKRLLFEKLIKIFPKEGASMIASAYFRLGQVETSHPQNRFAQALTWFLKAKNEIGIKMTLKNMGLSDYKNDMQLKNFFKNAHGLPHFYWSGLGGGNLVTVAKYLGPEAKKIFAEYMQNWENKEGRKYHYDYK